MDYRIIEHANLSVVECRAGVTDTRDAMALAYACAGAGTNSLLIHASALPPDFFQLSTGFAGDFVQRLVNLRLCAAAVFGPDIPYPERFREFLGEARRHPQFRAFGNMADALEWLSDSATPASAA